MSSKQSYHHVNGRRPYVPRPAPVSSPQQDITSFIHNNWVKVCEEYKADQSKCAAEGKSPSISYYTSNLPEGQVARPDFKRFDLDGFLERRLLAFQANKQQSQ